MKKLLTLLIILFFLYYSAQLIYKITSNGYNNTYYVTTDGKMFTVEEVYSANKKEEKDNYYITIKNGEYIFNYQLYEYFDKKAKIVTDIYAYENCIYPIFKGKKALYDITCVKDNKQYYRHSGDNSRLEEFTKNILNYGYNKDKYVDNSNLKYINRTIRFNENNVIDNHKFAITNYKGVYTVGKSIPNKIYNLSILKKDDYNPKISYFYKQYYLLVKKETKKTIIYLLNIYDNTTKDLEIDNVLSNNAYVQGDYNDNIYILDPDNRRQYEIDIKTKDVILTGTDETSYLYFDGKQMKRTPLYEIINKKFINNDIKTTKDINYERIDYVGGKESGFTYFYKKENNKYYCYRKNSRNDKTTFLFTTNNINRIKYIDDFVYYVDNNEMKYYNDFTGSRVLLVNSELNFNQNINFHIYK